jgi:magnesium chelatase family protein
LGFAARKLNGKKATHSCPCGYLGEARCQCTQDQVNRYRARVSGPLLDRIDIHIEVPRPPKEALRPGPKEEDSATVAQRVSAARERQLPRQGKPNAELSSAEIETICHLSAGDHALLDQALDRLGLSARAYHRILRVARTIADLSQCDSIETTHPSEAIGYRNLDRSPP